MDMEQNVADAQRNMHPHMVDADSHMDWAMADRNLE